MVLKLILVELKANGNTHFITITLTVGYKVCCEYAGYLLVDKMDMREKDRKCGKKKKTKMTISS